MGPFFASATGRCGWDNIFSGRPSMIACMHPVSAIS